MDVKQVVGRVKWIMIFGLFSVVAVKTLYADQRGEAPLSWKVLVFGMLGGLAFFLYGIEKMSVGMQKTAGNKMRTVLAAITKNRLIALGIGAGITMLIQSSSATTVMLVSFVQAGLMSFTQSLGVILGADIGTTITAQLIAFKLTDYALLMIAVGFGLYIFAGNDHNKNIGEMILGFGILFYGMKLMSDAMSPLRSHQGFVGMMAGLQDPLVGLLVGTLFTAVIQSSAATIGVVIVLSQQGLLTLEAGIPVIFGANIGTCITAGLAAIGTTREAKRVALAHVLFKIFGVALFIFWVPTYAGIIAELAARFDSDIARQIANAHAIFNISLAVACIPFTPLFAHLIERMLPAREVAGAGAPVWHLDESSISSPALAIDLARREISRIAGILSQMLRAAIIPFMSDEKLIRKEGLTREETELLIREIPTRDRDNPRLTLLEGIDRREEEIDFLDEKLRDYLIQIARRSISEDQAGEIYGMVSIANDMERIGDLIHRNMLPLIAKKKKLEIDFSDEGKEEILIYHQKVCRQIELLQEAFAETNLDKARAIMASERKYLDLEDQYRARHLERIRQQHKKSVETHEVHMELMDLLKQIVVYSSNIAGTFLMKRQANQK
ncbi:MAG: Na/Pi cotransporter family protein [Thermodesulfobacteriota bacterium]